MAGYSDGTHSYRLSPEMPKRMRPKPRHINDKLYENVTAELNRMMTYFYVQSDSPIASCIVCAAKSGPPYIHICGDYVSVNKFIRLPPYYVPHVAQSLHKIAKFKEFGNLDMTDSFH